MQNFTFILERGLRDLFIDEAHTALGIFSVFFPCMLPTPLCGIFSNVVQYGGNDNSLIVSSWGVRLSKDNESDVGVKTYYKWLM